MNFSIEQQQKVPRAVKSKMLDAGRGPQKHRRGPKLKETTHFGGTEQNTALSSSIQP